MEESESEEDRDWIVIKIHRTIKNALAEPRVVRPLPFLPFSSVFRFCVQNAALANHWQNSNMAGSHGLFRRIHSCGLVTRSATYDDRWNVR